MRCTGRRLGEPLSGDRFPQPFQEPFELGHSFSELPELLGRLLSLGVDPVSKLSDLRVYPVAQPAVVTRRDPPHAEQYCCDHAHGGQHDRDDSRRLSTVGDWIIRRVASRAGPTLRPELLARVSDESSTRRMGRCTGRSCAGLVDAGRPNRGSLHWHCAGARRGGGPGGRRSCPRPARQRALMDVARHQSGRPRRSAADLKLPVR